ncbi:MULTISPECIES: protein translocase subunit SecF [Micromonospora]|uniref:Protein-export membrane protein SecF n=1 Tax=Micromonospora solifontis TaxID=2487138 RepID=A0ABX9WIF9_9ACTN|nr:MULTISPECIES: protein translocase subunit SecF [Micromonospora]NES13441.1 protein translocase subunit SecF [Micromonospora sp. PPF5-17B]NES37018.1 protein translocase subunit SecF [Micromonospora solifontis]NES55543.1 protein translocase subunit SecF [Micromonospora sp. PPF5-6]RNL98808.1 protein translocase subunit SecF [Micromonospora solifontis]
MAKTGLAARLYRGEADLNIVGRRKLWFTVAGVLVLIAVLSFAIRGFSLGIEFAGGNSFQVPASVGTMAQAEDKVNTALAAEGGGAKVVTAQKVGSTSGQYYELRTTQLSADQANAVKTRMAQEFGIQPDQISGSQVSEAWGSQVTSRALLGLLIFIAVVAIYLVLRFEWRMAVASIASLLTNLVLTAGIYSLVGFEVTPSTIIGFLTILGFALYDVVVVFDKVQENTRGITANNNMTYGEAANLALNQSLMRSLNTSVVALLPVGGLLFIGAGLLGAGTLKDLGLVLFVGMAVAFLTSILLATPLLVLLKNQDPRISAHNKRVLARRGAIARGEIAPKGAPKATPAAAETIDPEAAALAGAAPKVGARPVGKRPTGTRGGRPGGGGNRPGGAKRR